MKYTGIAVADYELATGWPTHIVTLGIATWAKLRTDIKEELRKAVENKVRNKQTMVDMTSLTILNSCAFQLKFNFSRKLHYYSHEECKIVTTRISNPLSETVNGSQLAKMKKSIPHMPLP